MGASLILICAWKGGKRHVLTVRVGAGTCIAVFRSIEDSHQMFMDAKELGYDPYRSFCQPQDVAVTFKGHELVFNPAIVQIDYSYGTTYEQIIEAERVYPA